MIQKKPPHLTELLNPKYLQRLQDAFAHTTHVTTAFIDPDGHRVTAPSNWHGVCPLFFDNPDSFPLCRETTRALAEESRRTGGPVFLQCPHMDGLITAAVPLIVDGLFLGSWIFGQMLTEGTTCRCNEESATIIHSTPEAIEAVCAMLPVHVRETFDRLFALVQAMTETVVELGRKNMEMSLRDKELRDLTEQLENRDRVFSHHILARGDAMYISDYYTGEILMVNQSLCDLLELPMEKIVGQKCTKFMGRIIPGFCTSCLKTKLIDENGESTGPHTRDHYFAKRGTWLRCTHQAITWGMGRRAHLISIEDATQEHTLQEQLETMAFFNSWTDLPNRNHLSRDFERDLARGTVADRIVICVDLSALRMFGNAYGSDTSNAMLKEIVHWLRGEDFGDSALYHLDGYEFCIVLGQVGKEKGKQVATHIIERFEKPWIITKGGEDISYVCGAVVAVLLIPDGLGGYTDLENLLSRTLSKGQRGQSLFFYDQEMDRLNREHIEQVLDLKKCVSSGMEGFSVMYQPITSLASGTWEGLEALCRWNRPGYGPVPPPVFIHEAESRGLINRIGSWVLDTAVRQAKQLRLDELNNFFMSVNISPFQMMDESFADSVAGILERHDYPGSKLNLEITESAQMTFSNFTMDMITRLRSMGVRLALDDFGTGYSSFNSLKHLPVDFLKTERDFILGIEHDSYMQYFLYIMSEIAHANQKKLIAEGIETIEQLRAAKNNGADYIQGYFFSKPISADDLAQKLERFTVPDHSYIPGTAEVVNIKQWLSGKNAYELTPSLFNLMNQCMQIMLTETDVNSAFLQVFEIVGEHFKVSRAFAFVQEKPNIFSDLYEWCAEDVIPQKHLLQKIPVFSDTPSLLEAFKRDGMLIASTLDTLPKDMQHALKGQDVSALALLPMWDGEELSGFVGFDKTTAYAWSPEEIVMLWNLAMLIANTVKREKLKIEVVEKKNILDTILQNSGFNAYVTDLETDEILWVNDNMKKNYPFDPDIIGRVCYEALANGNSRCSFCQIPQLLEAPKGTQIFHEFHSDPLNRDFTGFASLIQWTGNRTAHIHYSMDITDQRDTQTQLEYLASTDMLTGALNRVAIIGNLQTLMQEAHANKSLLALCYINIDHLSRINRRYGNDVGDQALFHTAQAIRSCTQSCDLTGRFGGDEFLVLMPGCAKGIARVRMMQARSELARVNLLPDERLTFSFGVADNTELHYMENAAYFSQLIGLAENRMEDQKLAARSNDR